MTTTIVLILVVVGFIALGFCYMIIRSQDVLNEMEENNAPYKLEPAERVAISAAYKSNTIKRKYTKRKAPAKKKAVKKKIRKLR